MLMLEKELGVGVIARENESLRGCEQVEIDDCDVVISVHCRPRALVVAGLSENCVSSIKSRCVRASYELTRRVTDLERSESDGRDTGGPAPCIVTEVDGGLACRAAL